MNEHSDGISCISKPLNKINFLSSGSFDGEMIIWDL